MLARLQKFITLGLLVAALAWLVFWWPRSAVLAVSGFLVIVMSYALFLALEFVFMHIASRDDPAPRASFLQMLRAWFGEVTQAPRVFCWRQPFFWNAVPDRLDVAVGAGETPKRGVVFIHGFVCNRGFWTPWLRRLMHDPAHSNRAFVAVNLEPVFGDVEGYVQIVESAVQRLTAATGMPPVLVCHSMGGLAARAWLRAAGRSGNRGARVAHIVTIGTPHRGTWLGRFSRMPSGRQMRIGSEWLNALGGAESAEGMADFTCWYSNCDNIVFPASTATLPGANNQFVPGVAHVHMAFDARVMEDTFERIISL